MRTFIAIKIVPEKKLIDLVATLKKSLNNEIINWADPDNLHLTLRFIGETEQKQVAETMRFLEEVAQRFHPFQFSLRDVGFFKSKNQPRILFFAIENGLVLNQLAAEIEERIVALGFSREERLFNPHLTIGRIKFIQNKMVFYDLINQFKGTEIQKVTVSEIVYYQSILTSSGAIYKPLKIISLKNLE
jgi:RNA 2',3'-cyclic 3'-phosphodiesterase